MFPGAMKARRWRRWWAGLAAALALAACGGGTSQYDVFVPVRLLVLGDESSLLTPDGRKYAVNALDTNGVRDCVAQPLWVQSVAAVYGFAFAECNPDGVAAPQGTMLAAAGARVADLVAQVDALAAGSAAVADGDLATVLVGSHDVLDLYAQFPTTAADDLIAEARQRGTELALQVNRLVGLGARVIVSTLPDMGLTPYALAQKLQFSDTDRADLLTRLTAALNAGMRVQILNDGRYVGLVLADEMVQAMARAPGVFGLTNAADAVCTQALPDCTTNTLVSGGTAGGYLWADDRTMAYGGHRQLGLLAEARARNNPF